MNSQIEAAALSIRFGVSSGRNTVQGSGHVLTRDEEAEFTALVQRQSRFVFRVAYAVLLNAHDAEDAVQETFLKLFRNGAWRGADNERAFLARAAWRVAVDRWRALRPDELTADHEPAQEPLSSQAGPEEAVVAADQHALIHAMIDSLPEDLRLPLVLSAHDDLNSREIAAILGIPEGTVRTRLQRARQTLRQKLENLTTRDQMPNGVRYPETQHA